MREPPCECCHPFTGPAKGRSFIETASDPVIDFAESDVFPVYNEPFATIVAFHQLDGGPRYVFHINETIDACCIPGHFIPCRFKNAGTRLVPVSIPQNCCGI